MYCFEILRSNDRDHRRRANDVRLRTDTQSRHSGAAGLFAPDRGGTNHQERKGLNPQDTPPPAGRHTASLPLHLCSALNLCGDPHRLSAQTVPTRIQDGTQIGTETVILLAESTPPCVLCALCASCLSPWGGAPFSGERSGEARRPQAPRQSPGPVLQASDRVAVASTAWCAESPPRSRQSRSLPFV